MLNIDEELKTIYRNDIVPLVSEIAHKILTLYFPDLDLTISNDRIVGESFSLMENLCSDDDITLGSCEGAMVELTVANLMQDLSGYDFVLTQTVNDIYTMPLGSYKVDSCKKQNDLWFRHIVAFDSMKKTDVDVSTWYNNLTFPISVKAMRESLLTYLGLQYEDQTLTNDSVLITKTINPTSLKGRDVLIRLCEINAGFGHFTRLNKFKVIQLSALGLYPSETLYPAEDLFPAESGEILAAGYKKINYEEYIVEPITKLQISQEDGDEGVVVGTGDNVYVITENFFLYGKTAAELETIANNIFLQIKNKYYRPHETVMVGLPYLEVGDTLSIITGNDAIETFMFTRNLKGIQALEDTITASGSQRRTNKVGLSTQIEQLKGKSLKIQKDVDGVRIDVTDLDLQLTTEMNVLAGEIEFKVDKNGIISAFNMSPELIKLAAEKIAFEGLVTANDNFKILLDGSMEAKNGKFSGTITGGGLLSVGPSGKTSIANGDIITGYIEVKSDSDAYPNISIQPLQILLMDDNSNTLVSANYVVTPRCIVNGSDVITFGNIGSQPVNAHTQISTTITPQYSSGGTGPNIALSGVNAASVNWCNDTFQPKTSSDFRLKRDIKPLSKAREFILGIKTKLFRFKDETEDQKQHSGVLAQELISLMDKLDINSEDSALIETYHHRPYKDEGMFGETLYRVNYTELIPYCIKVIQEQDAELQAVKNELSEIKSLLKLRESDTDGQGI